MSGIRLSVCPCVPCPVCVPAHPGVFFLVFSNEILPCLEIEAMQARAGRVATLALVTLASTANALQLPPARVRAPAPRASASSWSAVQFGNRAAAVAALDGLREAGAAPLWKSLKLAPRRVSLAELSRSTKLDEKTLDPSREQYSLEDIQSTFIKVIIGSTLGAIVWAVGSDALGLDAGLRFTGTYLFAGVPIAILAIGSTAPGILFLPIEAFKAATASAEEKRSRGLRVIKHEASHMLCAHVLGLPIQDVVVGTKGPRVIVHDEEAATQPGVFVESEQINALAVVAVSGLMAEADAYGAALGVQEDLKLLNQILLRCKPPMKANEQQDLTRYAALTAWTILKKHERAYEAIVSALEQGKGVAECLQAAEAAEAAQSQSQKAEAVARAEAIGKETPMERAAREREEMAARGRGR